MVGNHNPVRLILAVALGITLVFILGVLAIQIIEFRFYREPDSVWPGVTGSGASSVPAARSVPAPILPITTPSTVTVPKLTEALAGTVSAVSNAPAAVMPTGLTPGEAPAEVSPAVPASQPAKTPAPVSAPAIGTDSGTTEPAE